MVCVGSPPEPLLLTLQQASGLGGPLNRKARWPSRIKDKNIFFDLCRMGKVPFVCLEYFDTDTLGFLCQLQIPDTFRERDESVSNTQYTIYLQGCDIKRLTYQKFH